MKQNKSFLKKIELPRTPAEWLEAVMNFLFFLCGMLAVGCVLLISVYMIASGVPAIRKIGLFRFLFGTESASCPSSSPACTARWGPPSSVCRWDC